MPPPETTIFYRLRRLICYYLYATILGYLYYHILPYSTQIRLPPYATTNLGILESINRIYQ